MTVAGRLKNVEWEIILALLVPAAAAWGLIELAGEVLEGSTAAMDERLLLAFRSASDLTDPLGPDWLEEMMRDFTALGGVGILTLVTFATACYLVTIGKKHAALAVLVAVGGGILISTLVKEFVDRPRPQIVPHGSHVTSASFPSGHSMMAATVYLTLATMLARVRPRWRTRLLILFSAVFVVLLVGVSRVYLGVHWPTDVLAGWSVGAGWAIGCWLVTLWLQRRGAVEPETDVLGGDANWPGG